MCIPALDTLCLECAGHISTNTFDMLTVSGRAKAYVSRRSRVATRPAAAEAARRLPLPSTKATSRDVPRGYLDLRLVVCPMRPRQGVLQPPDAPPVPSVPVGPLQLLHRHSRGRAQDAAEHQARLSARSWARSRLRLVARPMRRRSSCCDSMFCRQRRSSIVRCSTYATAVAARGTPPHPPRPPLGTLPGAIDSASLRSVHHAVDHRAEPIMMTCSSARGSRVKLLPSCEVA